MTFELYFHTVILFDLILTLACAWVFSLFGTFVIPSVALWQKSVLQLYLFWSQELITRKESALIFYLTLTQYLIS